MNIKSHKLALAAGIALTFAAIGGTAAADTTSTDITDARQETQIWTTYALSPYLRANDLKVSVHNGKATLTGNVDEGVNKELARQIALGVSGIKDVDNQIVVDADYVVPARPADRTYGEITDDATITAAVKSKLLWSRYTDGASTEVNTERGKVTLQGTADSAATKAAAGRLALNTRGVVSVDNQLVVSGAKPTTTTTTMGDSVKGTAHEAGQGISDSWITTKVKSTFLYSRDVDSNDISVSTSNGVVTLKGKVDSGAERALAIELARNVRGVKSVHSRELTI